MSTWAGDHLAIPFQCELCVSRNRKGGGGNSDAQDRIIMACIWQVNLVALWDRESGTVHGTRRSVLQTIWIWQHVRLEPTYPPLRPFPVEGNLGYSVAIAMIMKSREKGRDEDYQQFETI